MSAVTLRNCARIRTTATAVAAAIFVFAYLAGAGLGYAGDMTPAAAAASNDPMTVIQTGISQVLAVFRDTQMPLAQRRAKLRELAGHYFDFQDMARSALGYHWRDLTPEQRAEFVPLFADFIQNAYLSKLEDSGVKKIREEANRANIQYTRQSVDGDYAQVFSAVTLENEKEPLQIDYMLHRKDGQWRIYDVTVAAISVIGNYRNQFNRVINNEGYDKLVADLKLKTQQLQEYMDHPPTPAPQ
jgi:phospholipid transport system substrate-binding protein